MTLEEAIKHAEEVADGHDRIKQIKAVTLEECRCAEEHRQLAEWLKDYKRLLEQEPKNLIEPLTDTEQRIFLSAMSKEEKICKELDNDKVDDGTCIKLLPICHRIERKVKKALFK